MNISVLMAVYFKEKPDYLHIALESIWNKQTLKPDEIILVEDGVLTNELYAVISQWEKNIPHVLKVVKLDKNQGLSTALNKGIEYCKGKYIARMDSDDFSHPERFQRQFEFLEQHEDIYVVGGSIQEFNDIDKCLIVRHYPKGFEEIKRYMAKASPLAHATVMFRKKLFDNGVRYSPNHLTSQDIELWYRVVKAGYKISSIDDITYYVRISPDFYSRRTYKKAINEFKIYWFGILDLYGFSWKLIYPLLRLGTRMMPAYIVKLLYSKRIRNALNPKN